MWLTDLSVPAGIRHSCPNSVCPTLHMVGSRVDIVLNAVNGLPLGEGWGGVSPHIICWHNSVAAGYARHACTHMKQTHVHSVHTHIHMQTYIHTQTHIHTYTHSVAEAMTLAHTRYIS